MSSVKNGKKKDIKIILLVFWWDLLCVAQEFMVWSQAG